MKRFIAVILSSLCFFAFAAGQGGEARAQGTGQIVDKDAVWMPGPGIMDGMREKCGALTGTQSSECFISTMESSGASPQALAFARSTGSIAYLRDFRETGRADVAYVHYPFRADENFGCFLVNGEPPVVDVDDPRYEPKDDLQKDRQYNSLVKGFPNVSRWPGQRSGPAYPLLKKMPGNVQRFVVGYRLLNGCITCERLGNAWFAFDFDGTGKFMGTRLMGMDRNTGPDKEIVEDSRAQDKFTDPKKPIEVAAGREFTIVLGANRTTGYRWELANPPDGGIIQLIRNEYKIEDGGKSGGGRQGAMDVQGERRRQDEDRYEVPTSGGEKHGWSKDRHL